MMHFSDVDERRGQEALPFNNDGVALVVVGVPEYDVTARTFLTAFAASNTQSSELFEHCRGGMSRRNGLIDRDSGNGPTCFEEQFAD